MTDERAARAAQQLYDRYEIRAEWARLNGLPEMPPAQRGRWYRIADYDRPSELVTLGDVDGEELQVPYSRLKLSRDVPEKAVMYNASTFEPAPGAEMVYVAVCPKGHQIPDVSLKDEQIHCRECTRDYQCEHE